MFKNVRSGIAAASINFAVVLILISSCSPRPDGGGTVRIGGLLPLSGDAAVWGVSMKEGIDLAAEEINSQRGASKPKIEMHYEDDRGLPSDGVAGAQKLIGADKVKGLVGVANSSVALAIIPIIDTNKVVFVSGGASSPKLSGASKYFFRTWPSDLAEGIAMARYAKQKLDIARVAILYINNEYGIGLRDPFTQEFEALGGSIVSQETFAQEATDFRTQLVSIRRVNPQAVYLVGNPREMARCLKQARELGLKTQFLSVSGLVDPEVVNIAGAAAEGVILTDASFDPASQNPETQKFLSRFMQKYGKDPGMLAVTGYDALRVLIHAFDETGGDPTAMAASLRGLKGFPGAAGTISFDDKGDVSRPVRISTVKDGKFVTKEYLQ